MPKTKPAPGPVIVEYLGPHDGVDVLGFVDVKAGTTIEVTADVAGAEPTDEDPGSGLLAQTASWACRDTHTTQHGVAVESTEES